MKPEMSVEDAKALFERMRTVTLIGQSNRGRLQGGPPGPPVPLHDIELFIKPESSSGEQFLIVHRGKQRVLNENETRFLVHPFGRILD